MITILQGDVVDQLRTLPDKSVHCVVTSPPYWGLRDYGMGGQIGLEKTPEEYIEKLGGVFREVWRVLRDDGTVWLNMGDCYNSTAGFERSDEKWYREGRLGGSASKKMISSLKPKDLIGMPWRLAFALQKEGWYLRSDIIWNKPNPMPESVTDRPTKSHEYIFLLTKNARYFYDADAIREPASEPTGWERSHRDKYGHGNGESGANFRMGSRKKQDLTGNPTYTGFNERWKASKETGHTGDGHSGYVNSDGSPRGDGITRNARTVWTITTQARPEAHFATFPDEIPRRCIKAGTSEYGCCPKCGAPYKRITEPDEERKQQLGKGYHDHSNDLDQGMSQDKTMPQPKGGYITTGWQPSCKCKTEAPCIAPCIVLDPFGGSGTTGEIARELKRDAILIDINPEYIKIMRKRLRLNEQLVSV